MITAPSTVSPRYASASVFSFWRIIALISGGEYCLPPALDARVAVRAANDLERDHRLLFLHLAFLAAHEALDREDGVLRVGHGLPLGDSAHETLAALGECHHRRGRARAFGVLDDGGVAALEDRHARVGRAQVDAYCSAHWLGPPEELPAKKSESEYGRSSHCPNSAASRRMARSPWDIATACPADQPSGSTTGRLSRGSSSTATIAAMIRAAPTQVRTESRSPASR